MSTDAKKTDNNESAGGQPSSAKQVSTNLQWLREGIAGIISLAVLAIATIMMYGTYNYARQIPPNADSAFAASSKESYERQKDIMLYALALLGTVTGYYLGRVPAELHAQQAERSADTAHNQLQKTQTKLADTADKAAAAAALVNVAEKEKNDAKATLNQVAGTLEIAEDAISKAISSPQTKVLGDAARGVPHAGVDELIQAQQEIRLTLREISRSGAA